MASDVNVCVALLLQELYQNNHKCFYVKPVETVSYGSNTQ